METVRKKLFHKQTPDKKSRHAENVALRLPSKNDKRKQLKGHQ